MYLPFPSETTPGYTRLEVEAHGIEAYGALQCPFKVRVVTNFTPLLKFKVVHDPHKGALREHSLSEAVTKTSIILIFPPLSKCAFRADDATAPFGSEDACYKLYTSFITPAAVGVIRDNMKTL